MPGLPGFQWLVRASCFLLPLNSMRQGKVFLGMGHKSQKNRCSYSLCIDRIWVILQHLSKNQNLICYESIMSACKIIILGAFFKEHPCLFSESVLSNEIYYMVCC